jgi:hypothetical protein
MKVPYDAAVRLAILTDEDHMDHATGEETAVEDLLLDLSFAERSWKSATLSILETEKWIQFVVLRRYMSNTR